MPSRPSARLALSPSRRPRHGTERVRRALENLRERYGPSYLATDPLELVHRYRDPRDQEIVGFIASSLAFGHVAVIRRSLEWTLGRLGDSPRQSVEQLCVDEAARSFSSFRHRWIQGRDVVCLLWILRQMIERAGSVGEFFRAGVDAPCNMRSALERFSSRALALDHGGLYRGRGLPPKAGVRYFFPLPSKGSACKRLNLLLRWMVRPADDGLDLGLWSFIPPSRLIVPLDIHIHRIGAHLGWTERKTPGWHVAVDITRALAEIDARDPTKYDFALCRFGMLEGCPRHAAKGSCPLCALKRAQSGLGRRP